MGMVLEYIGCILLCIGILCFFMPKKKDKQDGCVDPKCSCKIKNTGNIADDDCEEKLE